MEIRVQGPGPAEPFHRARDAFEPVHDLDLPVHVRIRENPDERTWAGHYDDHHVLNISRQAASSVMAHELALHEFAHMNRFEQGHASHTQSTTEALYLAFSGRRVERRKLTHCYQIANHMKDIYADDITLAVAPADKLAAYLESELAAALADRPAEEPPGWRRLTPAADPELTAMNAAFALALLERHDGLPPDHRIYDLAQAAARDAPGVDLHDFKRRFRDLPRDPGPSEYRRALVDVARRYVVGGGEQAAD